MRVRVCVCMSKHIFKEVAEKYDQSELLPIYATALLRSKHGPPFLLKMTKSSLLIFRGTLNVSDNQHIDAIKDLHH